MPCGKCSNIPFSRSLRLSRTRCLSECLFLYVDLTLLLAQSERATNAILIVGSGEAEYSALGGGCLHP